MVAIAYGKRRGEPASCVRFQVRQDDVEVGSVLRGIVGRLIEENDLRPEERHTVAHAADLVDRPLHRLVTTVDPVSVALLVQQELARPRRSRLGRAARPDSMDRERQVARIPRLERVLRRRVPKVPTLQVPVERKLVTSKQRDVKVLVGARLPPEEEVERPAPGNPPRRREAGEEPAGGRSLASASSLFAETLRAWVGQLKDGPMSLVGSPLVGEAAVARSAHPRRPIPVRQVQQRMGGLYEAPSRATFRPIRPAVPVRAAPRPPDRPGAVPVTRFLAGMDWGCRSTRFRRARRPLSLPHSSAPRRSARARARRRRPRLRPCRALTAAA
jgi:hypothetical protein